MTDDGRRELAEHFLLAHGLRRDDEHGEYTPLTGGVSSDLWRVDLPGRTVCVKAALPKLRVADDWHAPLSRNGIEYDWLRFAGAVEPAAVPNLLGQDRAAGFFAMEFLPPSTHPTWKSELFAGRVDPEFAGQVGDLMGKLHQASTHEPQLADAFATDENFEALRIEPYLRVSARRVPVVAEPLEELAERTAATRFAVVHGDLSPKNVLVGPAGPVVLDAECAWFGDPAFDIAFCLTHLALKMLVLPDMVTELRQSAHELTARHATHVTWETTAAFEQRVACLVPALLLARAVGASPVEYLDDETRAAVRRAAVDLLMAPATDIPWLLDTWVPLTVLSRSRA